MVLVLVKTTPRMQGHVGIDVEPAAVAVIKARPDVWWWCVALEDDGWHKGGAWTADPAAREETDLAADMQKTGDRLRPVTPEEEDGDDRW